MGHRPTAIDDLGDDVGGYTCGSMPPGLHVSISEAMIAPVITTAGAGKEVVCPVECYGADGLRNVGAASSMNRVSPSQRDNAYRMASASLVF